MKNRIKPPVKTPLLRGALYLLLAISAIPFTLAQRNATTFGVIAANTSSTLPQRTSLST
jgi:hypothetical protein